MHLLSRSAARTVNKLSNKSGGELIHLPLKVS